MNTFLSGRSARFILALSVTLAVLSSFAAVVSARPHLDRSFGEGGIATYWGLVMPQGLVEGADGRLYALTDGGHNRAEVTRILPDGRLDTAFGDGGSVDTGSFPDWQRFPQGQDLAVTGAGKVLVTGPGQGRDTRANRVCGKLERFSGRGVLDIGFATRGIRGQCVRRSHPKRAVYGFSPESIDLTGQGKILVAGRTVRGRSDAAIAVARFKRDGSLDRSFKGGPGALSPQPGIVEVHHRRADYGTAQEVLALRGRKVLVAGRQGSVPMIARLNPDGSLDRTFARQGVFALNLPGYGPCRCRDRIDVDFDSQGRILLMTYLWMPGGPSHGTVILRLNRNGRLDRSFGRKGWSRPFARKAFYPDAMAVEDDGKVVVLGDYRGKDGGGTYALFRLDRDGKLDPSFFAGGLYRPRQPVLEAAGSGSKRNVVIDRKGRIVASSGWFESPLSLLRIIPR